MRLAQRDITIFDTQTGRLMKTFSVEGWPTAFAFGKDKELYLATREGKLEVWDWVMGERLQDFDTNDVKLGPISSMVVTPRSKAIDPDHQFTDGRVPGHRQKDFGETAIAPSRRSVSAGDFVSRRKAHPARLSDSEESFLRLGFAE